MSYKEEELTADYWRDRYMELAWRCGDQAHFHCYTNQHLNIEQVSRDARQECALGCRCWRHSVLRSYWNELI